MDVDQLRRALLEHGLHEAASLVDADIEQQQVENDRERDEDEVIRANFERMRERDPGGSRSADYGWAA